MTSYIESGTGALDGAAALGVAYVEDAFAMPADDSAAQQREVAADTEAGAAAAAVPGRGESGRLGSMKSDSPKGVA